MGWIYLILAGIFEIGFGTTLKLAEGFTKPLLSVTFFVFSIFSFYFLAKAIATIPVGTAYAVWTGIGSVGLAVIGIIFFKEPVSVGRIFFICTLVGSVIGLKLVSD
jgi:quaternary ammonium compound-resistance protein SugE